MLFFFVGVYAVAVVEGGNFSCTKATTKKRGVGKHNQPYRKSTAAIHKSVEKKGKNKKKNKNVQVENKRGEKCI